MFDITFIDVPNLEINNSGELNQLLTNYYESCKKITQKVTGYDVMEKPFNYTLGLLCLSTYIKEHGYKVGYINMNTDGESFEYIVKNSNIICFSPMTITVDCIIKLINDAKLINNTVKVIVGGYHASYMIKELFASCAGLDLIIIGEGERQVINYLDGMELSKILGIAYRNGNEIIINDSETPLEENQIPSPDFSLIGSRMNMFNIHITTMRGCIGKCHFCVNQNYWGRPRFVPLDRVKKDITYLNKNLPEGTLIHISDNVFTYNKKRFKEVARVIDNYGRKFIYECDTLSSLVDEEVVKILSKIGVIKIHLGFEDCVDDILKMANKSVNHIQNLNAINIIAQVSKNICIYAYWLIGLPGTSKNTIEKNKQEIKRLLLENHVHIISPKIFIPYPGTYFWDNAEKYGINILNFNWKEYERRFPPFPYRLEDLSSEEIYEEFKEIMYMCEDIYRNKQ